MTITILLDGHGELDEWRDAARRLLQAGIAPSDIDWQLQHQAAGDLFAPTATPLPPPAAEGHAATVPRPFLDLANLLVCHSDPGRFALLYRLLWRLQREPALLSAATDPDIVAAHRLEKAVRRDAHKMKAFVRFKELDGDGKRRRFLAWFEPDHHIVGLTAPFFRRRFADMDWVIATPKGSASWDGERLEISPEPARQPDLTDATDDLWRTYFAHIFNPARLKVKAMQAEMPKKYWKNLPEAALIPDLIAGAAARVRAMEQQQPQPPPAFHQRLRTSATELPDATDGHASLAQAAAACTRCPLHAMATRTVMGEGPVDAAIMLVGEQPGDAEDLAGRPFIGPAGTVLDTALAAAGLDRRALYVTNAVKHFKYQLRGKHRLHQRPDTGEIEHCRWWLAAELALVKPRLVVAMGATALQALTGATTGLVSARGRFQPLADGGTLFTTVHPAYLLRLPDADRRADEIARFHADWRLVAAWRDAEAG